MQLSRSLVEDSCGESRGHGFAIRMTGKTSHPRARERDFFSVSGRDGRAALIPTGARTEITPCPARLKAELPSSPGRAKVSARELRSSSRATVYIAVNYNSDSEGAEATVAEIGHWDARHCQCRRMSASRRM